MPHRLVTSFLLVSLGFQPRKAILVSLLSNTAPVAFGALGVPIVALAGVTGLDMFKLSAMVGRQLPFLSLILPAYLVVVIAGGRGLKRAWRIALVAGASFALAQFLVSNFWGPYAADIIAALASIAATVGFLRLWRPRTPRIAVTHEPPSSAATISARESFAAWMPWTVLSSIMVLWTYLKLFQKWQVPLAVPGLHNGVLITLYQKPYTAVYGFQPLSSGTAVLVTLAVVGFLLRPRPNVVFASGAKALRQVRIPGLTVLLIMALAYLYNYSGMAYTLGAAVAALGPLFPLVSGFLGWVACFLSGSDTASNLLFGNLQVAAAHQLGLSPVLLAATNSSGGVVGKMISPQNIAIGASTVGLVGEEGHVLHSTFWHSILLAALIGVLACAQAYWLSRMIP